MSIRLQALPQMAELWDELVQVLSAQDITIGVADFGGFRTAADTAEILNDKQADYDAYVAAGGTLPITGPWDDGSSRPIAPYGRSFHDYGAARDVKVLSAPAGMSGLAVTAAIDAAAESVGLVTGASYGDPLHVQLPISLDEAKAQWAAYVAAGGDTGPSSSTTTIAAFVVVAAAIGVVAAAKSRGLKSWL